MCGASSSNDIENLWRSLEESRLNVCTNLNALRGDPAVVINISLYSFEYLFSGECAPITDNINNCLRRGFMRIADLIEKHSDLIGRYAKFKPIDNSAIIHAQ